MKEWIKIIGRSPKGYQQLDLRLEPGWNGKTMRQGVNWNRIWGLLKEQSIEPSRWV